ncbi:MAG: hypothetical protein ACRYFS_11695 [Janthinobacterium lividum]
MPEENNNPGGVFGSTASLNAGSALEAVQAEEIQRLQAQNENLNAGTAGDMGSAGPELMETSTPEPIPPTPSSSPRRRSPDVQRREDLRTQASASRAEAARQQAERQALMTEAARVRLQRVAVTSNGGFDTSAANARAANRHPGFAIPDSDVGVTSSAPKDANANFDPFVYDEALHAQRLQTAGDTPPEGGWGIPDNNTPEDPSFARVGAPSFNEMKYGPAQGTDRTNGFASRMNDSDAPWARVGAEAPPPPPPEAPSEPPPSGSSSGSRRSSRPRYANAQEARDLDKLLRTGLEDEYAQAGRVPEIGGKGFKAELDAQRMEAELIAPEEPTASSPYADAMKAKSAITENLRNDYASRGDFSKIGTAGFKAEVKAAEISQGFQEPKGRGFAGAVGRIQEDLKTPFGPLQYAYGAGEFIQGATRDYAANNSGQYLTPEQQQTANAGLLPGIGSLVGTVAGSVIPGLGSWAGSLVGGGIGQGLQTIIGAGAEREQSVRQTSEIYGAATGASTDALKEFADTIRSTNAATKEMQTAFTTMANAGPGIGSGTLSGAAFMSGALGERYNPALSGLTRAVSSDPLMRSLQPRINATGGDLGAGALGNIAIAEAFSGDWDASNGAATLAEGSLTNHQWAADTNRSNSLSSAAGLVRDLTPLGIVTHPFQSAQDWAAQGRLWTGQDPQFQPGADATKAKIAADRTAAFGVYTAAASAQEVAQSGMGMAGARIDIAQNTGASAAQMSGLAATLSQSALSSQGALTGAASAADAYIAAHPELDAASRLKIRTQADSNRTTALTDQAAAAKATRSAFEMGLQEDESAYGRTMAGEEGRLTRGLLSGRRYDQLQGDENGIVSSEQVRARQLRVSAYNPINSPAERDQMLTRATEMETNSAQQQYGFKMAGYAQNVAQDDQRIGAAGLRVTQAQITGGPQEVYTARGTELEAYRAKIAELGRELAAGGMTVDDRIAKERELTSTRQQVAQATDQRQQAYFSDQAHLVTTQTQTAEVGLDRALRRGGNAAFDDKILALNLDAQTNAQNKLDFDRRNTPGNTQRLLDDELVVKQTAEASQESFDTRNNYRPTSAFSRQMANDQTAFQVALEAPYIRGGAESDPLTRGNAVIKDIRQDMAQNEANRLKGQRDGSWTDDNETDYSQHRNQDSLQLAGMEREKRFALFNAIPNTIIGGGAMGNSVSSFSFDALTAAYAPNELQGSWGPPKVSRGGSVPGSLPGNSYDGFQQHAAAPQASTLTTALQTLAHGLNNQQMTVIMQQVLQTLQRIEAGGRQKLPPQNGPRNSSLGAAAQSLGQSANTNRPSLTR